MKKYILVALLLFASNLLHAQLFTGLNSKIAIPTADQTEIDFGFGGEVTIGYHMNKNFDFHLGIMNLKCLSILGTYNIRSMNLNIKYIPFHQSIKPYIGLGLGYYMKKVKSPLEGYISEYGIGLGPSIGLLFEIERIPGLYATTDLSLNKVLTDHKLSYYVFNIGISYYWGSY